MYIHGHEMTKRRAWWDRLDQALTMDGGFEVDRASCCENTIRSELSRAFGIARAGTDVYRLGQ